MYLKLAVVIVLFIGIATGIPSGTSKVGSRDYVPALDTGFGVPQTKEANGGYKPVLPAGTVDGNWGSWQPVLFEDCQNCGTRKMFRQCNNPSPSGNGRLCLESGSPGFHLMVEKKDETCPCVATTISDDSLRALLNSNFGQSKTKEANGNNKPVLPAGTVDGNWGPWTAPYFCPNCGTRKKTRQCNNPSPAGNGRQCFASGFTVLRLLVEEFDEACRCCKDKVKTCAPWKRDGYCRETSSYYTYMRGNCPGTCGFCSEF